MATFRKAKATSYKEDMVQEEKQKIYPKVRLPLDLLPDARKWEIGKKYAIALEVKMTGIEMNEYSNESSYDILGLKVITKKGNSAGKKVRRY